MSYKFTPKIDSQTKAVLDNLNKFIANTKQITEKNMYSVLLMLKAKAIPRTPIDTSNMRGSYYTVAVKQGDNILGQIGNTAFYSVWQHESLKWKHTVGEAKFLERTIHDNVDVIKKRLTEGLNV